MYLKLRDQLGRGIRWWTSLFLLIGAMFPVGCYATVSGSDSHAKVTTLLVDGHDRHQTIAGFGTCLYLNTTSPYDSEWFRDLYTKDLGCSIVRMELTPWVLPKNASLGQNLQANISKMDFSGAGGPVAGPTVAALDKKKLDRMLLVGSLWTPPHWMKSGAKLMYNDTNSCGGHLKMDAENLTQFGRYVAAYVKGFQQKYGVSFYAVSIQNELLFDEPYNSCVYTPEEYVKAIKAVYEEFQQDGIKTKIEGPESVGPDGGWLSGQQIKFIEAVEADPEAAKALGIFSIHGYGGNGVDVISDSKALVEYQTKIAVYHKPSWMTESSGEQTEWIHSDGKGGQDGALTVAKHILQGLVYGQYEAVVYWQITDGGKESPSTLMPGSAPPPLAAKYVAAKHFFRYIRPGAVRVGVTPALSTLAATAFVHDLNKTVTVVLVNTSGIEQSTSIQLRNLPSVSRFKVFISDKQKRFDPATDAAVHGGKALVTVPPFGVVTLVGESH